ncbi:MAG: aminotransferase class I/II-fold pyridoxal phosphate-dependent enzyme [Patescibacteria group bacterium]
MNYSKKEFKPLLDLTIAEKIFQPEHGYSSPDGTAELGRVIKKFEVLRTAKNSNIPAEKLEILFKEAGIGVAPGTTAVVSGILHSIAKLKKGEIILPIPTYPVYDDLIKICQCKPVYLYTQRSNNFLPNFNEIINKVTKKTIAIILVYPNNPSFTTFKNSKQLRKLVSYCQKNKIFLIVDNIYQDMIFSNQKHIEIFSLTKKTDYIFKVYGLSKDRPFFSGHRAGYYIGDSRIAEDFLDHCLTNWVCNTNVTKNLLALDLIFRITLLKNLKFPTKDDLLMLGPTLGGWSRSINYDRIYSLIKFRKLFKIYKKNLLLMERKIIKNLRECRNYVNKSKYFEDYSNDLIGNAIIIKIMM